MSVRESGGAFWHKAGAGLLEEVDRQWIALMAGQNRKRGVKRRDLDEVQSIHFEHVLLGVELRMDMDNACRASECYANVQNAQASKE